ncbi:amino acid/amide ABC transporter membrane protein 2 (HAAT family) [Homoserinimonas aerilata]|uniref:Amino acid/amide ABC transporter membrane protein 2 (HAAT family) n=1 Tax=Homoserinimonas aerilata TaxID=1162970 RepID=A0A542YLA7_9MICO|nr:branched-chain amino acid ABC transporter permease [Homoserinimonas aerilata]TQL48875.1 amino acid/amide ABC transporter membrane protein 2 (HAAT family) [Homoserinimonas aerilata]
MDWNFIVSNTASWLLMPDTIAYAIATVGLAVHFGYGGLLNFGQAGFMALGAYGYAISILSFGLPWWVGILVGVGASVIFALLLGLPTLRLRADYLAIATIAAAEIVRLLFQSVIFDEYTNSADGLGGYHAGFREANPFPPGTYGFGPWTYNEQQLWVRVFGLALLAAALIVVWLLMRSPWGRVVKGIREDEDAVRALGKNVFSYKMQVLVLGGVLGTLGGVVMALPSAVVPGVYLPSLTFFLWTILLLGGAATIFGPVIGAAIFWMLMAFLSVFLPSLAAEGLLPGVSSVQAGVLRYILIGLVLMAIVIFRPQGILGNKKELTFNAR